MKFSQDVKDRRLNIDDFDIPSTKSMDIDVETSATKIMYIDGNKNNSEVAMDSSESVSISK